MSVVHINSSFEMHGPMSHKGNFKNRIVVSKGDSPTRKLYKLRRYHQTIGGTMWVSNYIWGLSATRLYFKVIVDFFGRGYAGSCYGGLELAV